MKKFGKVVVLSCTLAVIMGLSLPASSQARDSRNSREGHRPEKISYSKNKGHGDSYNYHGRDSYRYPVGRSRRPCQPWRWSPFGSFCFWTPSWGFGGSF